MSIKDETDVEDALVNGTDIIIDVEPEAIEDVPSNQANSDTRKMKDEPPLVARRTLSTVTLSVAELEPEPAPAPRFPDITPEVMGVLREQIEKWTHATNRESGRNALNET